MAASDPIVDLRRVMAQCWGIKADAANNMIARGQVTIDGHTIRPQWVRHWRQSQLQGRVLKCLRGEARMFGSRLIEHHEQMSMG